MLNFDAIRTGQVPARKGGPAKEFQPPPIDPVQRAKAEAAAKAAANRAALYKIWQQAEVAREAKKIDEALKLYRQILEAVKENPVPNYKEAALERIESITKPKPVPSNKEEDEGDGSGGGD